MHGMPLAFTIHELGKYMSCVTAGFEWLKPRFVILFNCNMIIDIIIILVLESLITMNIITISILLMI